MAQRGLPNINIQRSMNRNRVNVPGLVQSQWWPLYDYQTKTAAATAQQTFFAEPIGQSGKTINDTNMSLSSQIPKGQSFIITGVQVEFYPGLELDSATATQFGDDVYNFYKTGNLTLTIGSKDFIQHGNLLKFAPVNRLAGEVATGLSAQQIQYFSAAGREFTVERLALESNQNFNVTLRDMPSLPSGVAARLGVTLNGYLGRNAQ
jgi:hypothetical protein